MRSFVPMLAQHLGVNDQELLEKDVRLHALLASLVRDPTFGPHLVFKGGTCLIKCYLDYPRFSTDLDFTRIAGRGEELTGQGTKTFRRGVRPAQRTLEVWFKDWAQRQGYQSEDPRFFSYGRSNSMMTANLRYPSASTVNSLVKVQINFEEPLLYPTVLTQAKSLLRGTVPPAFHLLEGDLGVIGQTSNKWEYVCGLGPTRPPRHLAASGRRMARGLQLRVEDRGRHAPRSSASAPHVVPTPPRSERRTGSQIPWGDRLVIRPEYGVRVECRGGHVQIQRGTVGYDLPSAGDLDNEADRLSDPLRVLASHRGACHALTAYTVELPFKGNPRGGVGSITRPSHDKKGGGANLGRPGATGASVPDSFPY